MKKKKKKRNDLLNLIIFLILITLIKFLDSCLYFGTKGLVAIIIKNSLYTFMLAYFFYTYYYKTKNKRDKYEKFFCKLLFLGLIFFFNINSINCLYALLSNTTTITTDRYYVYSTTKTKFHIKKYYLYLNNRKESVRINKTLYNDLDNNKQTIKVTYYHNTEVLDNINIIK